MKVLSKVASETLKEGNELIKEVFTPVIFR